MTLVWQLDCKGVISYTVVAEQPPIKPLNALLNRRVIVANIFDDDFVLPEAETIEEQLIHTAHASKHQIISLEEAYDIILPSYALYLGKGYLPPRTNDISATINNDTRRAYEQLTPQQQESLHERTKKLAEKTIAHLDRPSILSLNAAHLLIQPSALLHLQQNGVTYSAFTPTHLPSIHPQEPPQSNVPGLQSIVQATPSQLGEANLGTQAVA